MMKYKCICIEYIFYSEDISSFMRNNTLVMQHDIIFPYYFYLISLVLTSTEK